MIYVGDSGLPMDCLHVCARVTIIPLTYTLHVACSDFIKVGKGGAEHHSLITECLSNLLPPAINYKLACLMQMKLSTEFYIHVRIYDTHIGM